MARGLNDESRRGTRAAIRSAARRAAIPINETVPATIKRFFRSYGVRTKYEIARVVAMILPDLAWRLPPETKIWQSEHFRMSIFDAAAAAIAYLGRQRQVDTAVSSS